MQPELVRLFAALRESADFEGADLSDVNACAVDGDNALHYAVRDNDLPAARALIEAGVDINKAGDLGYTPLHVASEEGNIAMVKLLVEKGANLFALSEGYPPFTVARLAKQDHVCDLLGPLMKQARSRDPKVWIRARIVQLQRELAELKRKLNSRATS
jgi:ankyrin repeat protein